MKLFNTILAALLVVTGSFTILPAQEIDEHFFTSYTAEQGLSSNNITGIAQDARGYIWIATTTGLNQFNGSSFVQYHSSNDSLSLPSEHINGLVWIDRYRLAAYTNGLHIIDTRTGATRNLFIPYHDKQYQYKFNTIVAVTGNDHGDLILLTRSGMYHYDKNYNLVHRFDYYPAAEVPVTSFGFGRRLIWAGNHALVIVSTFGLYYYDLVKRRCKKMEAADCPLLAGFLDYPTLNIDFFQTTPGCLFIVNLDTDSLYYLQFANNKRTVTHLPAHTGADFNYRSQMVQVNDTLFYITGHLAGFYKFSLAPVSGIVTFHTKKYFPFHYCRSLLTDRNQQLWVATTKGIFRQDNKRQYVQQAPLPDFLQEQFPVTSIDDLYAIDDKLYVATRGGAGLLVYDKQKMTFIRRIGLEKCYRDPNAIQAIVPVNDSVLWVGSNGPLFAVNIKNSRLSEIPLEHFDRAHDWIADIYKDRQQHLWISSEDLYRYDALSRRFDRIPVTDSPYNRIQRPNNIREDTAGNIWIAGHGLIRYNTRTRSFDRLIDSFPYIKMPDRQVTSFVIDRQNNIWINANDNGLLLYDPVKKTYGQFTRDDGLPDNNIACMIIIRNKLWLACLTGVACMDLNSHIITRFGSEDGFPGGSIGFGAKFFYDSLTDKAYIGYRNAIVRFDPNVIYQHNRSPQIFIESITTGDQRRFMFPEKDFTTSWHNSEITITIGSINFISGNSQRFAYRLKKADSSHWQQLGAQNTFSISNLAPGTHRVQMQVYSSYNRWPARIQEIDITILPPFWKRSWFIGLSSFLLPGLVLLLLKWRTGVIRKKESINKQLAEAQLLALQTQMNPHFIFNSLNSIKGMILDNQQQKASRYLSKFARIIRITVHQSKEIFTTLHENIEYLENYLLMEKLRFEDSFSYTITTDENIEKEEILIPTMMIQPLVENAIWHGLMHNQGEKIVSIRFSLQCNHLCCTIEDNGIGINRSTQLKQANKPLYQSVGLSNLRNRIHIMNEKYDTGCTLCITDLGDTGHNGTGTSAVLCFTIMYKKPSI